MMVLRAQLVMQAANMATFVVLAPKAKELKALMAVTSSAFVVLGAQEETQMASACTLVKPREDGEASDTATVTTMTAIVAQRA